MKKMRKRTLLAGVLCLSLIFCGCQAAGQKENNSQSQKEESQNTQGTDSLNSQGGGDTQGETQVDMSDIALKDACSKYFSLGVGINGSTKSNLTTYTPEYMELVKKHFNSVTMTNLMKSAYILQQRESQASEDGSPVLSYDCIDDTLQWCMDNGVKMRGHTLVWHAQAPDWFFREGYKSDGALVDKETMLFRMESYIKQILTHVQENYPGVIYCWDVVNEAVDPGTADPESFFGCRTASGDGPNPWYETIGPEYVEYAFKYARQYADKDVKLFYNDFNTYESQKRQYIYKLCKDLQEKGLIDGIGMQGYWGVSYPDMSAITGTITYLGSLGLEIQITELSVGVDEETPEEFESQAKRYSSIFFNIRGCDIEGGGNANITNVTLFGLKDHYVEADKTNARLFDKDYQPKPAFDKIMNIFLKYYQ